SSTQTSVELSLGGWEIAVIGWNNNGEGNTPLNGDTFCDVINVNIQPGIAPIDLNPAQSKCSNPKLTTPENYNNANFKNLSIITCGDFNGIENETLANLNESYC